MPGDAFLADPPVPVRRRGLFPRHLLLGKAIEDPHLVPTPLRHGFQAAPVHGGHGAKERLESLFRTFHNLKGDSWAVDLTQMADLCHAFEEVLNLVKSGALTLEPNRDYPLKLSEVLLPQAHQHTVVMACEVELASPLRLVCE